MAKLLENPEDIVGKRFGSLVAEAFLRVEAYVYGKKRRTRKDYCYRCLCDCGNTIEVKRVHLLTGHVKSCKCQWKPKNSKNWLWKGHEGISGQHWSKIQYHARTRGLEFNLSIQEAWSQFVLQGQCCALTGIPLSFAESYKDANAGLRTASLDRIDSTFGYSASNVQWVHKDINFMKMDLGTKRFIELCRAVADFSD